MPKNYASDLKCVSMMLSDKFYLRAVEPHIYSVLPENESGNEYDGQFGIMYDLIACNPLYNRVIWGYSIKIFSQLAYEALCLAKDGPVLDVGCGSLAFTAKVYSNYTERPVILLDQSLKMLRMAKTRLMKLNGKIADNLVFLHSDALCLPFKENSFSTIISENLLHCLNDTNPLLTQLQKIMAKNGKLFITTLVRNNRWADKYLQALADSGKLIPRYVDDHATIFEQVGLAAKYETIGNLLLIRCDK
ncbi:MAG: methyltransferase domain-containing protein [Desulfarculus sp.]|nr:methyltransferase domain-containing protein [Desulfarculus sp.]